MAREALRPPISPPVSIGIGDCFDQYFDFILARMPIVIHGVKTQALDRKVDGLNEVSCFDFVLYYSVAEQCQEASMDSLSNLSYPS